MRRFALMLAVLATLTACNATSGGDGGGSVQLTDYVMHLTALDNDVKPARRSVDCTVIGYAADKVVQITDTATGRTQPYELNVDDMLTPTDLVIKNYAGVDRIEILCTMVGQLGDSFHCEVTTSSGRVAPLFGSVDYDRIDEAGKFAICTANINARS